jgi:uncharacterized protein
MAITLYDATVVPFTQTLGAVATIMERGLAHCVDTNLDPAEICDARLHPGMLPFRFQILSTVHHSIGAIEETKAGLSTPPTSIDPLDYAGLQAYVAEGVAKLKALTPADVNALEGRDMLFQMRDFKIPFTAEGFLLSFSLPNLHFHATTAYDILRHKGAPLGKRDYLGQMRVKG